MSVNEKMTAIADNIRDKTGGTKALTLDQMASGVNEVYEAGKKSEYDSFWDEYLNFSQASFIFAGSSWSDKIFKPNKDIVVDGKNANYMFAQARITDLEELLEKQGVVLDLSNAERVDYIFYYCSSLTKVPVLNFSKATNNRFSSIFQSCSKLHTIRKLILPVDNASFTDLYRDAFAGCTSLVNIEVEGLIVRTISFAVSPLSAESLKSIITHLKDYSGTTSEYTYTITFNASAFETLEAGGVTSPNSNSWTEYIDDLKWNLTLA